MAPNPAVSGGTSLRAPGTPLLDEASLDDLLDVCRRAAGTARRRQRPVLASWAVSVPPTDPAVLWRRGRQSAGRSLYWQSGWDGGSCVAIGAAHELRGRGADRIGSVAASWSELAGDLTSAGDDVVLPTGRGPLLVGGFGFASTDAADDGPFPQSLMWVPALQIRGSAAAADGAGTAAPDELRLNAVLLPDSEPAQIAEELARLAELCLAERADTGRAAGSPPGPGRAAPPLLRELPPTESWKDLVARAVGRIRAGAFEKVVLARELRVRADRPYDVPAAVERLRTAYPEATVFAVENGGQTFVGATPEYLVRLEGDTVRALGLAGTAPRGATARSDAELERRLTRSAKIRHEHDVVVRMLRDALHPTCARVETGPEPTVVKLANVQHLATVVEGRDVLPGWGVLRFVERLHPTPALGGFPRDQSLDWLAHNEGLERGWYAGTVGWTDAFGQGEFAVAIRCALIRGDTASLYAGCGIVADSDPQEEYDETCAKLRPMLHALGIE